MCLLNSRLKAHFQLQLLFGSIILSLVFSLFVARTHTNTKPIQEQSALYFVHYFPHKLFAASLYLNSSKLKQLSPIS